MLKIIAIFIFATLVQFLSWQSERQTIRIRLRAYFAGANITESYITRYQIVGLVFKSVTMTVLCMLIYAGYWSLLCP